MTAAILPGVAAAETARVAEVVGTRMAVASALAVVELVRDPGISQRGLIAGLVQAHLLGVAAAIASAHANGQLNDVDAIAIVSAAGDMLGGAIHRCFADSPKSHRTSRRARCGGLQ